MPSIAAWRVRAQHEFIPHVVEVVVADRHEPRRLKALDTMRINWPNLQMPVRREGLKAWAREMGVGDFVVSKVEKPKPVEKPKQLPPPNTSKSTTWRDGEHFIARLYKRGYVQLGAGAFSTVVSKPGSDRVIKVSRKPDQWLDFVVWATKAGHAGGFAPKVYSFRRIEGKYGEFYVAVVERLEGTVAAFESQNRKAYMAHHQIACFIYGGWTAEKAGDAAKADRNFPGALRFAVEFKSHFVSAPLDLHGGNFMVRKDGTLVLTDPLTGDKSSAPARMRSRDLASLPLAA